MMNVSRFWLSTFCRKPKGRASIDWRTLSIVAVAFLPSARSTRLLARSSPPVPAPIDPGEASANSLMAVSCSSVLISPSLAISMETASTCLAVSRDMTFPASSSGRLINRIAALRIRGVDTAHNAKRQSGQNLAAAQGITLARTGYRRRGERNLSKTAPVAELVTIPGGSVQLPKLQ